jgi:ribonucleoside-diphosphate reductase beta chain
VEEFCQYIDYIGDRRLVGVGLEPLHKDIANPLPWLSEMMEIKKETNFFEGRVTEYRRGVDLAGVSDDDL